MTENNPYEPAKDVVMLNDMLALCAVPRWVVVETMRQQNVGEHSFRTAIIALWLAGRMNFTPDECRTTMVMALFHDREECKTGDLPSGIPKPEVNLGWLDAMPCPPTKDAVVKLADTIEAITYLRKWGRGSHAMSVLATMEKQVNHLPDDVRGLVDRAIISITNETGRVTP